MADNIKRRISVRSDTLTNWLAINPVLATNELVFVTDPTIANFKVGDGVTAFTLLPYIGSALAAYDPDNVPTPLFNQVLAGTFNQYGEMTSSVPSGSLPKMRRSHQGYTFAYGICTSGKFTWIRARNEGSTGGSGASVLDETNLVHKTDAETIAGEKTLSNKLQVNAPIAAAGIIESTKDGIKFPDGTVQTTADKNEERFDPDNVSTLLLEQVLAGTFNQYGEMTSTIPLGSLPKMRRSHQGYSFMFGIGTDGTYTWLKSNTQGAVLSADLILQTQVNTNTDGLALKANIISPTLTGIPAAPTAVAGTSTTQIATTAFVTAADTNLQGQITTNTNTLALKANIASPTFTGIASADTAAAGASTTQLATTAFVTAADTNLQGQITTNTNTLALKANITYVDSSIATEVTARQNADTSLQNNINLKANIDSPALTGIPTTPTPSAGINTNQITNAQWVKQEIASALTSSLRAAGNWDASTNLYPSSGTGANGAIRIGDLFIISVAGTLAGIPVDLGDEVYAITLLPGQVAANWAILEHNIMQATESLRGSLALANSIEASSENPSEDTKVVTLKKLWLAFGQYVSQARTITGNWTFSGIPSAPTAAAGTATTQIATTGFVKNAAYVLPQASSTVLGGIELGAGLTYNTTTGKVDGFTVAGELLRLTSKAYYFSSLNNALQGYGTLQAALTDNYNEIISNYGTGQPSNEPIFLTRAVGSMAVTSSLNLSFQLLGDTSDPLYVFISFGIKLKVSNVNRVSYSGDSNGDGTLVATTYPSAYPQPIYLSNGQCLINFDFAIGTPYAASNLYLNNYSITKWANTSGAPVTVYLQGNSTIPAAPYPTGITVVDQRNVTVDKIGTGLLVNSTTGVISTSATAGIFRGPWTPNTLYSKNDTVTQGGASYYANTTFTSGTSFVVTNWTLTATDGTTAQASTTSALALKANIASPTFTGIPAADTAAAGTATAQLATTGFVTAAISPVITRVSAVEVLATAQSTQRLNASASFLSPYTGFHAYALLGDALTAYQADSLNPVEGTIIYLGQGEPVPTVTAAQCPTVGIGGISNDNPTPKRINLTGTLLLSFVERVLITGTVSLFSGSSNRASITTSTILSLTFASNSSGIAITITDSRIIGWSNPNLQTVTITLLGSTTIPAAPYPAGVTVIDQRNLIQTQVANTLTPTATSNTDAASVTAVNTSLATKFNFRGMWLPNTLYQQYDSVNFNGGTYYNINAAFTSGTIFTPSNWTGYGANLFTTIDYANEIRLGTAGSSSSPFRITDAGGKSYVLNNANVQLVNPTSNGLALPASSTFFGRLFAFRNVGTIVCVLGLPPALGFAPAFDGAASIILQPGEWIVIKSDFAAGGYTVVMRGTTASSTILQTQITTNTNTLALKANIASPTFTGIPSADTAAAGTSTTQLATTGFVTAAGTILQGQITTNSSGIAALSGGDMFLGDWNPFTNTPALTVGAGVAGTYYRVSALGSITTVLYTAASNTNILDVGDATGIVVGLSVSGVGIPAGITVTAVDVPNYSVTLSAPITSGVQIPIYFSTNPLGIPIVPYAVGQFLHRLSGAWVAEIGSANSNAILEGDKNFFFSDARAMGAKLPSTYVRPFFPPRLLPGVTTLTNIIGGFDATIANLSKNKADLVTGLVPSIQLPIALRQAIIDGNDNTTVISPLGLKQAGFNSGSDVLVADWNPTNNSPFLNAIDTAGTNVKGNYYRISQTAVSGIKILTADAIGASITVNNTTGLSIGMKVIGPGFSAFMTIYGINGNSVLLSENAYSGLSLSGSNVTFSTSFAGITSFMANDYLYWNGSAWSTRRLNPANMSTAGIFRGAWTPNTTYAQYDQITQGGASYYANATFTSGTSFVVTNWTLTASPVQVANTLTATATSNTDVPSVTAVNTGLATKFNFRGTWLPNTLYQQYDSVRFNGGTYYNINAAFTSTTAFLVSNWTVFGANLFTSIDYLNEIISLDGDQISAPGKSYALNGVTVTLFSFTPNGSPVLLVGSYVWGRLYSFRCIGSTSSTITTGYPPGPAAPGQFTCLIDGVPSITLQPGEWIVLKTDFAAGGYTVAMRGTTASTALKANIASPTFTGIPAADTAAAGTSTTQLATTAFVTTSLNLKQNVPTGENLIFGNGAASNGVSGTANTIIGRLAGFQPVAGSGNSFIGYQSAAGNGSDLTGSANTFVGSTSGGSLTSGFNNSFFGNRAGYSISTGNNNVFVGYQSGLNNSTGAFNSALGVNSGPFTSILTNTTAIGYNAKPTVSNTVIIGDSANTANMVGIGTTTPTSKLQVNGAIHSMTGGFKFPDGTIQTSAGVSANSGTFDTFLGDWNPVTNTPTLSATTGVTGSLYRVILDDGVTTPMYSTVTNTMLLDLNSAVGITVGMYAVGTGIPAGTTVTAVNVGAYSATLSVAVTVTINTAVSFGVKALGTTLANFKVGQNIRRTATAWIIESAGTTTDGIIQGTTNLYATSANVMAAILPPTYVTPQVNGRLLNNPGYNLATIIGQLDARTVANNLTGSYSLQYGNEIPIIGGQISAYLPGSSVFASADSTLYIPQVANGVLGIRNISTNTVVITLQNGAPVTADGVATLSIPAGGLVVIKSPPNYLINTALDVTVLFRQHKSPDTFLGDWNPNTNTPVLTVGAGVPGTYYRSSVAQTRITIFNIIATTAATTVIVSTVTGITGGQTIIGSNIPLGTTVTAIDTTNKILTLSVAVTLAANTQLTIFTAVAGVMTAPFELESLIYYNGTAWVQRSFQSFASQALKANIASPTFTGIAAADTAAAGTSTTQLATTEFVQTAFNKAPLIVAVTAGGTINSTFTDVRAAVEYISVGIGGGGVGRVTVNRNINGRPDNLLIGPNTILDLNGNSLNMLNGELHLYPGAKVLNNRLIYNCAAIVLRNGTGDVTIQGGTVVAPTRMSANTTNRVIYDGVAIQNYGTGGTSSTDGTGIIVLRNGAQFSGYAPNASTTIITETIGDTLSVLPYGTGALNVDFNLETVRILTATGNIVYGASLNVAPLKTKEHYITNTSTGPITLSFPTGWTFFPGPAPTTLAAGKQAILSLRCLGTDDTTIKAAYVAQT